MSILEVIAGFMLIFCGVVITLLVMAQQAKGGMGTMGGADMYADMSTRSADAKMAQVTQYAGIAFFVLALAVSAISIFAK